MEHPDLKYFYLEIIKNIEVEKAEKKFQADLKEATQRSITDNGTQKPKEIKSKEIITSQATQMDEIAAFPGTGNWRIKLRNKCNITSKPRE